MKTNNTFFKQITKLGLLLMMALSMSACSKTSSWKEEVLLHDGSKMIVERSQRYGGAHEFLTQSSSVTEHTATFTLPNSNEKISWTSEFSEDIGRTNFNLLAVHVLKGKAYLVTEPNGYLSYNKWGRPNPPYIFFKYVGKSWKQIPLSEFPIEFKTFNLIANTTRRHDVEEATSKSGYVSASDVSEINSSLVQPQYQTILRVPIPGLGRPDSSNSGPKAPD